MRRLLAAAAVLLAACGGSEAADDDTVVGEMAGEDITVGDLEEMADAMADLPSCDEFFDGSVRSEEEWRDGCMDGDTVKLAVGYTYCDVQVWSNDIGYGVAGEVPELGEPEYDC